MSEELALNIALFQKIRDRIAAIPASYNQSFYCHSNRLAPCGTMSCLAGEAIICNAETAEQGLARLRELDLYDGDIPATAADLLGLPLAETSGGRSSYYYLSNDSEAKRLFTEDPSHRFIGDGSRPGWPEPFASQWKEAFTQEEQAAVAVAYLDRIIATGKVLE